jgi:hypothetical protein
MRWLVIIRPLVNRPGIGYVEGNATLGTDKLYAPDREAAEAQLPKPTKRERYAVVAYVSWLLMTKRERELLLAGAPTPEDPKAHHRNAYAEVASDRP